MVELGKKVGDMTFDGLITSPIPSIQTSGGVICKLATETTYKRGTILAKSTVTGKLYILGTTATEGDTLTPDCILCDDCEIGTSADVNTAVYTAGCFDLAKTTVASGHTVTEVEKDKLRERGIVFKNASASN